jgi:hypothetical protein
MKFPHTNRAPRSRPGGRKRSDIKHAEFPYSVYIFVAKLLNLSILPFGVTVMRGRQSDQFTSMHVMNHDGQQIS